VKRDFGMDLFEMDLFIVAISKYLTLNQPFTILHERQGITWAPVYSLDENRDLESIAIFSDYLLYQLSSLDFRSLPEENYYKIRALVDLLDRFIKTRKRKYQKISKEILTEFEHKILALRLGAKVDYKEIKNLDPDLYRFLINNCLDRKFFALGIQVNKEFALPFEIEANVYEDVLWKDLKRETLIDKSNRIYGYRFFYKERILMETDTEFQLTEEFTLLYPGITFYHPGKALHIAPVDKRNREEWLGKNVIEVVALHKKDSFFLLMRKANGYIYAIGLEDEKISSPVDSYFSSYKCRYELLVSENEFSELFNLFEKKKYYKSKMTQKMVLEEVKNVLGLKVIPEKKLVSKSAFLSYLFFPYAFLKFICQRKKFHLYGFKDLFKRPHEIASMNSKSFARWLEESCFDRSGNVRCFE
jgi:hypothetical protein